MIRVGINGYGRIGRAFHRQSLFDPNVEVVAINSRAGADSHAYLLKHDSMYGNLDQDIQVNKKGFTVNGNQVLVSGESDPSNIPWGEAEVDVVVEATGRFRKHDLASAHLKAGAKKVVLTAPSKDDKVATFVMGVNHENYNHEDKIVSNASCTTNALAPTMKVLNDMFGVESGIVTTVHAITSSQNILDNSNASDFRRARSLLDSIIPTTTGAMKAIGLVIPELKGKVEGMAFRVPVPSVSVLDMTIVLNKDVTVDEVNEAFLQVEQEDLQGILGTSEEPLVSIDFRKDTRSGIVDLPNTRVVNKRMVQLVVWYDNEWGYSARLNDLAEWIMRD
jgi:glyceraldehyde 3-phosphate dehydrogenase